MDPPPTGLLAGSTAPPPREAVFNPYRLPVSPPPGNTRPQPHRQPELLWLHWMVCLAAWTAEALCAHRRKYHLPNTLRPSRPGTFISRHVALSTSSTSYNVGLLEESLSSNMLYPHRMQPPPLVYIVLTPTASFGLWALRKTTSPLALLPTKPLWPDDSHIASMTPIHHRNHLRLPPLQLHHHLLLHLHLPAHAHVHHHPILSTFYMILPHPPLPRGQHLPADLLLPHSPRRWIVLINVLLMVADFYTVIFGKRLDTGFLPQHRLRLLLMKSYHHLL